MKNPGDTSGDPGDKHVDKGEEENTRDLRGIRLFVVKAVKHPMDFFTVLRSYFEFQVIDPE